MENEIKICIETDGVINSIEDLSKIHINKDGDSFFSYYGWANVDDTIILDEKGKNYVLIFCSIDYGGAGPQDAIDVVPILFRANEMQVEKLKSLTGFFKLSEERYKDVEEYIYPTNQIFDEIINVLNEFYNAENILKHIEVSNKDFLTNQAFEKVTNILNEFCNAEKALKCIGISRKDFYSDVYGILKELN